MSSNPKECKYAPVAPAESATADFESDYDGSGSYPDVCSDEPPPPSCRSRRLRSAVGAATVAAAVLLAARQLRYAGGGGGRRDEPPRLPTGLDGCPYDAARTDPNPNMTGPRVVWKMSFPNSGTSYTGKLTKFVSNLSTATTYGKEGRVDSRGYSVPLREDSPGGPFLSQFVGAGVPRYVLTKTHCGGRCCKCGPDKYVETQESFEEMCRTGKRIVPRKDGKAGTRKVESRYSVDLVQRAVHIIRDPFDNIVSRFHLERKHSAGANDTDWLMRNTDDFAGFQSHCREVDDKYADEDRRTRFINRDVKELFDDVPCHGEFYKYAMWHTHAVATTDRLRLPTYVLYYENYESDFERTLTELLEFLELPRVGPPPEFIRGKTYRPYYTEEQRRVAVRLMRRVASPAAWRLLERYADV